MDVLAFLILLVGKFRLNEERVGSEVVSLSLQEVRRQILGSVTIEPVESSRESWSWYTQRSSLADDFPPAWLGFVNGLVEEVVEQKILQLRVVAVCLGDVLQKNGSDDASSTPHERNRWLVELPLVLSGSLSLLLAHL